MRYHLRRLLSLNRYHLLTLCSVETALLGMSNQANQNGSGGESNTTLAHTRPKKSALLWVCKKCGTWNVSEHFNATIKGTLQHGSRKRKLTVNPPQCCVCCGAHGMRLHSEEQSRVVARVDASKRTQALNLKAVSEELNALQDETGEPATEHDANRAWFALNPKLQQRKGSRWWGMPFRRWRKDVSERDCQ